ncbi:MAG: hypothetical protein WC241_04935 [Candidatus Paceibacterota bacterium]|jgi:hypothetical protein
MSRDRRYRNKDSLAADVSKAIAESNADTGIGVDLTPTVSNNAVTEWHINPIATALASPYARIVHGAISSTGEVLACEYSIASKKTLRIVAGTTDIDDHNCPALWAEEGRRFLLGWSNHDNGNSIFFKCSGINGDIRSFENAPLYTYTSGGTSSYVQIIKIDSLSSANVDVFWIFNRRSTTSWQVVPVSVYQDSGKILFGTATIILRTPLYQCYISIADAYVASPGNQKIRIALGYNPATNKSAIYGFEIDCVTGSITNVVDDSVLGNMSGTNLPIEDTSPPTAFIPALASDSSRRLFYVGAGTDSFRVGYADWLKVDPDNAVYKVKEIPLAAYLLGLSKTDNAIVSYASAAYVAAMATATFEYEVFFSFRETPTGITELGRRALDTATGIWYLRLETNRKVSLRCMYVSGAETNMTTTNAIPGTLTGGKIGIRVVVNDALTPKIAIDYSLDAGATWVNLEGINPAALVNGLRVTTAPLIVGGYLIANQTNKLIIHSATYKTGTGGTLIAGVSFEKDWLSGLTTYTDAAGVVWALTGDAFVKSGLNTYGIAGERVGFGVESNYIAGMCFQNPSTDRVVYTAHTDGVAEILKMHMPNYGTEETLVSAPTIDARLIRPYASVNGGEFDLIYTNMVSYSPTTYTDFKGSIKAV